MRAAAAPAVQQRQTKILLPLLLLLFGIMMVAASSAMATTAVGRALRPLFASHAARPRSSVSSTTTSSSALGRMGAQAQAQQQQRQRRTASSLALGTTIRGGGEGSSSSRTNSRMLALAAAAAVSLQTSSSSNSNNQTSSNAVACSNDDNATSKNETATTTTTTTQQQLFFPEDCLEYDHYNGVTVHVDERLLVAAAGEKDGDKKNGGGGDNDSFQAALRSQLDRWRTEGRRGVWLHVPQRCAAVVPAAAQLGFDFHQVVAAAEGSSSPSENESNKISKNGSSSNVLVLSQWLPTDSVSRLPSGPTHQVGVGCLVWHPDDDPAVCGADRRMLVVKERTGPAAAYDLWKMPTGLADPSEDVHEAAVRELREETGLPARFDGLLAVRQAHSTPPATSSGKSKTTAATTTTSVRRKHSDLFFVCQLSLAPPPPAAATTTPSNYWDDQPWTACPTEIAAIRWMPAREYAAQERWQSSPVYLELNRAILDAAAATDDDDNDDDKNSDNNNNNNNSSASALHWKNYTLPLRYGHNDTTNALYKSGANGKKSAGAGAAASDNK